jgi:hypothetical protein
MNILTTIKSNRHLAKPTRKHFSGYSISSSGVMEVSTMMTNVKVAKENVLRASTNNVRISVRGKCYRYVSGFFGTHYFLKVDNKRCRLIQNFGV